MEIITNFFTQALYRPLFNLLVLIYQYIPGHDFGLAIMILTFSLRSLFYPVTKKSLKSQKALNEIQPKIKKIQNKYDDNKEKQMQEIMQLYKKKDVNPFGGCLPLLIQLPILIALYRVFWHGFQPEQLSLLYSFIPNPGKIDPMFFNSINLAEPNLVIAGIAAVGQFAQTKMMMGKKGESEDNDRSFGAIFKKQMIFLFPIFAFIILTKLPAAIGIYWITSILFSVGQQYLISKEKSNKLEKKEEEESKKEEKEEENKVKNKKNESREN